MYILHFKYVLNLKINMKKHGECFEVATQFMRKLEL